MTAGQVADRAGEIVAPPWHGSRRCRDRLPRPRGVAGVGGVITGWDQGLLGASVGETRKLDIPAEEGYGDGGFPAWGIPPGGGLFFEIEVLSIKGKKSAKKVEF